MQWMYLDTSVLIKRYSQEQGTIIVNELFQHVHVSTIVCLSLAVLEVVFALTRKRNEGRITEQVFAQAITEFKTEFIDQEAFSPVPIHDQEVLSAMDFVTKHNINTTNAIVLHSALMMHETLPSMHDTLTLWTSDERLYRAAQQEGLHVFDPERETKEALLKVLGNSW